MKDLITWRKKDAGVAHASGQDGPIDILPRRMNNLFADFFDDVGGLLGERPFHVLKVAEEPWFNSPNFEVSETEEEFRPKFQRHFERFTCATP